MNFINILNSLKLIIKCIMLFIYFGSNEWDFMGLIRNLERLFLTQIFYRLYVYSIVYYHVKV